MLTLGFVMLTLGFVIVTLELVILTLGLVMLTLGLVTDIDLKPADLPYWARTVLAYSVPNQNGILARVRTRIRVRVRVRVGIRARLTYSVPTQVEFW